MIIGIIGYGVVGKAVASAYDEVMIYDPKYPNFSGSIAELKTKCGAIFICVPTPSTSDNACDTRILVGVLDQLRGYGGLVICKSTATPNFYAHLEQTYSELKLAHVPEFLSPESAIDDYLFPTKIVIGAKSDLRMDVFGVIMSDKITYDFTKVQYCSLAEAAMFNYLVNAMLAMKTVISSEFSELSNSLGVKWDAVANIAKTDSRLGNTNWESSASEITGDSLILSGLAKFMNVDMSMLNAAIAKNESSRS